MTGRLAHSQQSGDRSGRLSVPPCEPRENSPNEAIAHHQEAAVVPDGACENATTKPSDCDIDRETIPRPIAAEDEPESYEDAIKRIRRTREEQVRKLNEQAKA